MCVGDGAALSRTVRLPGNRADIRERSTTVALHLLRRALSDPAAAVAEGSSTAS
ncbi:CinA-like protein [Mycobacterium talmoniae]|uniref:CinA-like protein n=1 Tax=Mycobacterium talmoniae TaxID=1858794 RepID=A0A2S8BG62_9MYCO|nr:CinA-like protein [Mycobacterium talmoniae]